MVEAKHGFIDDNPYLVYSPDAEATASGGGGAGFPVIEADSETGALSVTGGQLVDMLDTSPVLIGIETDEDFTWCLLVSYAYGSGYTFKGISIANNELQIRQWEAESEDDYPTPYMG